MPRSTTRFLASHAPGLRAVVASGSFHWGQDFARAGERISQAYGVPLLAKINKSGSDNDLSAVASWLRAARG